MEEKQISRFPALSDRKTEARPQPLSRQVFQPDLAVVEGCYLFHEVESQAGALFPGIGPMEGKEPVEDLVGAHLRYPRPFVSHRQEELPVIDPGADFHAAVHGAEVDGVLDDVGKRLVEQERVTLYLEVISRLEKKT